jgi:hypothetical protein
MDYPTKRAELRRLENEIAVLEGYRRHPEPISFETAQRLKQLHRQVDEVQREMHFAELKAHFTKLAGSQ